MIRCLAFIIVMASSCLSAIAQTLPADVLRGLDTTIAWRHIVTIAHDSMRGRDTPSPELERTADYLIQHLKESGVQPVNGTYEHHYTLERLDLGAPTSLTITVGGLVTQMDIKKDFIPFEQTGEQSVVDARVIFAGYGITAPEFDYDDYAGVDVRGAVVLVIRGEPNSTDSTWFAGRGWTRYGSMNEKVRNARKHGAIGVLVVDQLRNTRKIVASGHPWPSLYPSMPRSAMPLSVPDPDRLLPVLHLGQAAFDLVAGSVDSLAAWIAAIDTARAPSSRELKDVRVSAQVSLVKTSVPMRNIVGWIPGTDVPDEYVVMGAHYDHIGVGKPVEGDSIYNGADDNASGTTGLLTIAQALGRAASRPKRSIMIQFYSGEEKGLLGSKAYTRTPLLPLSKCVAMVNTDMIGRCDTNTVSIGGNLRCPDMIRINEEENSRLKKPYNLAYNIEQYFFRSDQANFAMKRIPVIFYFTGEHADYHKLGDEVHKIRMGDLVQIAQLALSTAWRAAELPRTTYIPAGWED
jgi:Peptidase family M28/PA domain